MKYEEHYLVTLTSPDGTITSERYDDSAEAADVYDQAVLLLTKGHKVELRRYTSVLLGMSVKAQ
ncbi:hypothetical protein [Streptomyces scopuliridis]|uniref:Uncharacterized protein n=1 Tax=Streptomyces scopuliridis TaxID=452529 RepID=A0ACD4ZW35_9ACTN|nr:hypothetical protein [Streptomyces scopuliridis]WSC01267.1 hypothetical protein OG835_32575 [Streptomyces scopuliridis]